MIPHRRQRAVNGSIGRRRGGRIGIHWAAFWLLTEGCGSQGRTAETRPQLNPSPNRVVGTAGARTGLERVVLIGLKNKDPELRSKTSLYYLMLFSQVFCTLAAMTGLVSILSKTGRTLLSSSYFKVRKVTAAHCTTLWMKSSFAFLTLLTLLKLHSFVVWFRLIEQLYLKE